MDEAQGEGAFLAMTKERAYGKVHIHSSAQHLRGDYDAHRTAGVRETGASVRSAGRKGCGRWTPGPVSVPCVVVLSEGLMAFIPPKTPSNLACPALESEHPTPLLGFPESFPESPCL